MPETATYRGIAPSRLGRDFNLSDRFDSLPVAIVNQAFVRKHFRSGTALAAHGERMSESPLAHHLNRLSRG